MVDAGQLEAALVNLVANARDAMVTPGTIRIGTRVARPHQHLSPEAMPDHDYLHISVSDDGPGMEEDVRLRAMEPFFTTKDVGRGSGLGLSKGVRVCRPVRRIRADRQRARPGYLRDHRHSTAGHRRWLGCSTWKTMRCCAR